MMQKPMKPRLKSEKIGYLKLWILLSLWGPSKFLHLCTSLAMDDIGH